MTPSSKLRIGSVPYLNAVPLTWGLEQRVRFAPPSVLAEELKLGHLDAALVSITEALLHEGSVVLDEVGIVSHGPVYSVVLAHRKPLDQLQVIHVDTASCTSVNLLRVLMAERGWAPELRPLETYRRVSDCDAVLLIGDPAIEFRASTGGYELWDLGAAWHQEVGLPFVYAAWVIRRPAKTPELLRHLLQARDAGLQALPHVIDSVSRFDKPFRQKYLGGHIQYSVGVPERAGVQRFGELMAKHLKRRVFPIEWCRLESVSPPAAISTI